MTTMSKVPDDQPVVEYMNILANPMIKKRVYRTLGYLGSGSLGGTDVAYRAPGDDDSADPLMRVLETNLKCTECSRSFYDEVSLDKHLKVMHSSYRIDQLVP